MPEQDDTPRLGEIARTLTDFRNEFRSSIQELVRRDVYDAQRTYLENRIKELHNEITEVRTDLKQKAQLGEAERRSLKQLVIGAIVTGAVSLMVALILVWAGVPSK